METRPVASLRPHPKNQEIYGDGADDDLITSVREWGVLAPLLVTQDGIVISGHRRLDAARTVGLAELPVEVFASTDERDILAALLESNRNRQKTNEQRGRESDALLSLEHRAAQERHDQQALVNLSHAREKTNEQRGREANVLLDLERRSLPTVVLVPPSAKGKARDKAGTHVGWSGRTVEKAVAVVKTIDSLEASGRKKEAHTLRGALNKNVGRAYHEAKEAGHITPQVQAAAAPKEDEPSYCTLARWKSLDEDGRRAVLATRRKAGFTFNQQRTDHIEWAQWSWNPVTGCAHDCEYCYARDIANRLYPQLFVPTFLPERLGAPANTQVPLEALTDIGYRNVFTCSMADLFGRWVPREWIEAVLATVRANPQWNFLFLTKFPARMAEFDYPDNAWLGTSIDAQARIPHAERAMAKVRASVKWLSCEPMLERLTFTQLDQFQWVVVGGASESTQTPEFHPPREWVEHLERQARAAGCHIYEKTNLLERIRAYPGQPEPATIDVPEAFKMGYLQRDITDTAAYLKEVTG